MRLLRCHIENFGKLSDYTIDFSANPQVFYAQNGWGKSTLAAFIKVMFYGFANEKKRGETLERERLRYKPWQGGVYGGEIWFEAGGKEYVMNRTFGSKEAEDTFTLYDGTTHLKSGDYSSAIGEELFQINQESFLRTVFLGQNDCDTKTTDSINAKIGNLADNLDDLNNYEKVQQVLKDLRNSMSPTRKTGSIKKKREEIAELKDELRKASGIENAVSELEEKVGVCRLEIVSLTKERAKVQADWEQVNSRKALEAQKAHYDSIVKQCQERQKLVEESLEAMGGNALERDSYLRSQKQLKELERLRLEAAGKRLNGSEISEKQALEEQFAIFGSDLRELDSRLEEGIGLVGVYLEQKNGMGAKKATLSSLKYMEQQQRAQRLQQQEQRRKQLEEARRKQKKSQTGALLLIVFGILGLLAGGILLGMDASWKIPGIVLLCIGVLMLALGGMLLTALGRRGAEGCDFDVQAGEAEDSGSYALEQEIARDEEAMAQTEALVNALLAQVEGGAAGRNAVAENPLAVRDKLYGWREDIGRLRQLWEKDADYQAKGYEEQIRNLQNQLEKFLMQYGQSPEDLQQGLQKLGQRMEAYERDTKEWDRLKKERSAFESLHDIRKLEQIQSDLGEKGSVVPKRAALDENVLKDRMQQMDEQLEELNEQLHAYGRQLEDRQSELEDLAYQKEQLLLVQDEVDKESLYYTRLGYVSTYLEKAKESLSARYIEPVLQSFKRNYELLSGESAEDFRMDANIHVTKRALGKQRETGAFSAGNRDLIHIVLRVALVDAMYQREKPFLILDDSFVNLDGERLKTAGRFLKQIAKEYQVIYFTCHESRVFTD